MNGSPERSPDITRYRLSLAAGDLDDALVRFEKPADRDRLPAFLFLYSFRWLTFDNQDTRDRVSPSKRRVETAMNHATALHDKSFRVNPEFEYHIIKRGDTRRVAIDFAVPLGRGAFGGILNPQLYRRADRELQVARDAHQTMRPDSIPPNELAIPALVQAGVALFRYSVVNPVGDLEKPANHLQAVLEKGAYVDSLRIVDEAKPRIPLPTTLPPIRSQALLEGREEYAQPTRGTVLLPTQPISLPEAS